MADAREAARAFCCDGCEDWDGETCGANVPNHVDNNCLSFVECVAMLRRYAAAKLREAADSVGGPLEWTLLHTMADDEENGR